MRLRLVSFDLAKLAEGQGARGFGPIRDEAALAAALAEAIASVKRGEVAVLDVRVAPEYSRATSSAVVREMAPPRRG